MLQVAAVVRAKGDLRSGYNPAMTYLPSRSDPYAAIVDFYDLEHAGYEEDLDLYLNLALVTGDPVLELGCGSGRLLVPLADAGHRVTGLDVSAPMLDRARRSAAEAGVADLITLHESSMTEADQAAGGPFGIAIVALNGLMHLTTVEEQRAALTSIRRALDPRGQLVLDLLNPTPDALRALDQSVVHEGTWTLDDGTRVDKLAARRILPALQRIETDLWYDRIGADGTLRRVATAYPMRYVHRGELELMLELAGFAEWQIYGSYELDPFEDTSERLIVTAEVTPA
ncbi:MAG: class I SAM-dependent methyltransferase [Chloroflexota bacterium]|nr:class I SAM-dependent methyltransferase [Chloroflexota bacterium]